MSCKHISPAFIGRNQNIAANIKRNRQLSSYVAINFETKKPDPLKPPKPPLKSPPISKSSSQIATKIPSSALSYHWDTAVPTPSQLRQAEKFFRSHPAHLLHSTAKFRTVNPGTAPEVAFLGRSNVGKSTLLNTLMESNICHTSSKPGRTRTMNFFAVGGEGPDGNPGKVVILDMPGYGKGSREEWGQEIMKYLVGRRQMRRAFLLVDPMHGLKRSDEDILAQFRQAGVSHQVILSKVDRILLPGSKNPSPAKLYNNIGSLRQIHEEIRTKIQPGNHDGPEALGEILSFSAQKSLEKGKRLGINQVRWAVLAATGLSDQTRMPLASASDRTVLEPEDSDEY